MLGFKKLDLILICFCERSVHTFGIKVLANRIPSAYFLHTFSIMEKKNTEENLFSSFDF